jgi:tetratricopeptide (TPR) repeat protein
MPERSSQVVPSLSADQRRVAVENFERARQVLQTGNYDYGIQLLRTCCRLDPANFQFRQTLRRAQKDKFDNNLRGSRLSFLTTPRFKARVKTAKAKRDYLAVLDHAEDVLTRNPWDLGTQMDMAEAFDALGLTDLAVFSLDQARQKYPKDATLNRALARLFEKRGDFQKAIALWQMVQQADPKDLEASHKAKDLAASETIARGGYEQAVSGTKESPIVSRMETAALEKADKGAREITSLQKRIAADPGEHSLYLQLAALFRKTNQLDRARATLQQGLPATGNHLALQMELLELDILPLRKNLEQTEAKLAEAKLKAQNDEDFDDTEQSVEELAKLKTKIQKEILAREVEIYRVKTDRFPSEASHRIELGVRLMKLEKFEEAIAELQQARREEKLKGKCSLYLGLCFRKRNNWRLAQRNFEEALQALPTTDEASRKEVLYQLAVGLAEQNDFARALDLGNELANMDYSYKNIAKQLEEWQIKLQEA